MAWFAGLLDSLLDRLATKLAQQASTQLDVAVEAALDQTEQRIEEVVKRLELRLRAAAAQNAAPSPRAAIELDSAELAQAQELDELRAQRLREQLRSRIGRYMPEPPDR